MAQPQGWPPTNSAPRIFLDAPYKVFRRYSMYFIQPTIAVRIQSGSEEFTRIYFQFFSSNAAHFDDHRQLNNSADEVGSTV